MNSKSIYISGMHSGQSPFPGNGIARCLRKAFPEINLIGVDHWQGSSGLHDDYLNDVLLFPQWHQIDHERHTNHIRSLLDEGHLWISSLDMEVHWLQENVGEHPNLFAPGKKAIKLTEKPEVQAFSNMEFYIADHMSALAPDDELHAFMRHHSWRCWLKSPYHDASAISSWSSFLRSRDAMTRNWKTPRLFLQRHITGSEESIAFCAHQGRLLGAVHMEKRQITAQGKTWGGRVNELDPETTEQLRQVVQKTQWSGGGELEYTKDPDGKKWIIECNPRFPAWIYGAALAGYNLPARMVSAVLNKDFCEHKSAYPFFVRVVHEVPAKEEVGMGFAVDSQLISTWSASHGGKGKGKGSVSLPELKDSIKDDELKENLNLPTLESETPMPLAYKNEVFQQVQKFQGETPARILLSNWSQASFDHVTLPSRYERSAAPEIRIGYSVKTSPTDAQLLCAKEKNFYLECISQAEIERVINLGVPANRVILNGPGKFWPSTKPPQTGLHMVFCDSIEEFERSAKIPNLTQCLGLRIRLPQLASRFGVAVDEFEEFERLVQAIRSVKGKVALGFHFHMASWAIGIQRWSESFQSVLTWCHSLEQLTQVKVEYLDLGGGFFPQDFKDLNFSVVQECTAQWLKNVKGIYFEPGRALTQDAEILVSRVLDIRHSAKGKIKEIVVDASVAELPLAHNYPHRIFFQHQSGAKSAVQTLEKGGTRILGRICMEDDILSYGVKIPEGTQIGDLIVFGDAGAYERSMSYEFGRG